MHIYWWNCKWCNLYIWFIKKKNAIFECTILLISKKVLKESEMTRFEPLPEQYVGFWDQDAIKIVDW